MKFLDFPINCLFPKNHHASWRFGHHYLQNLAARQLGGHLLTYSGLIRLIVI
jgi:hypothetical protein